MNRIENEQDPEVDRRVEKRVTYTAILGFKEVDGKEIPVVPESPNATGANLSLGGICFQSTKRPKGEHAILYLPDGARAVVRLANITFDFDSSTFTNHCEVVRWLPDDAKTVEPPTPEPVPWPLNYDVQ